MREAVIVEAVRTPLGRRNGQLAAWEPADLLAEVLRAVVDRAGVEPGAVDDVVVGCVNQVGVQACDIARWATLGAGFPVTVPGTTIDRQCGSSQQAVHFAAQGVLAGAYDVVIAAGVEMMTHVPIDATSNAIRRPDGTPSEPYGRYARHRLDGRIVHQGISADLIAAEWRIERPELDAFALRSHQRAARARAQGRFDRELLALPADPGEEVGQRNGGPLLTTDEGIRPSTSLERLAALDPAFAADGLHTAGSSSQISDGASAVLIAERECAKALGLDPRARFHAFALAGSDPTLMLTGPIPATHKVLERSGLAIDDLDVVEINEAFSSVVLAWGRETGADFDRVNVNGGAIALGHPSGCSGARLLTTLVHELERSGGTLALQTMCEGGGQANAMIIERLG